MTRKFKSLQMTWIKWAINNPTSSWRHILELQQVNYIEYKHASRHLCIYNNDKIEPPHSPALDLLRTKAKALYWNCIQIRTPAMLPIWFTRWENRFNIDHSTWPSIFTAPFKVCRDTCLQSFQYSIIHRILACNALLYVRKVETTNHYQYVYCINTNLDDISHYLVTCPPVSRYWESFVTWWNSLKYSKLNPLAEHNIILGFPVWN